MYIMSEPTPLQVHLITSNITIIIYYSRLFTVSYFSMKLLMSIIEFDRLPSIIYACKWTIDVSENGEGTKYPWVGVLC